nr:kinesin-like protein KIF26B [Vicugna pacos]
MNSVAGNKERLAVSTRGKKYGVNEVCSPTKPAAPFSPESWYRKAYEESRAGNRPTPEGAGSALGSSGTPSPGSGTSSPSSFTGSPGPASPGIGTSSPGSLGGSSGQMDPLKDQVSDTLQVEEREFYDSITYLTTAHR